MDVKKISDDHDIYELSLDDDERDQLTGDVYDVAFVNTDTGDESDRQMFAARGKATVAVPRGESVSDTVTVSDAEGNEVTGDVTFG